MEWILIVVLALIPAYTLWQLWPPRMERLGRNAWIGLRTVTTSKSEEHRRASHRAAWPWVILTCGLTLLVVIGGAFWLVQQSDRLEEVALVLLVSSVVHGVGLIATTLSAQTAARRLDE